MSCSFCVQATNVMRENKSMNVIIKAKPCITNGSSSKDLKISLETTWNSLYTII